MTDDDIPVELIYDSKREGDTASSLTTVSYSRYRSGDSSGFTPQDFTVNIFLLFLFLIH
jgi:hypothetical protein